MLDGVEIGLALLLGPVGAPPQVLLRTLCWACAGVEPWLVEPVDPVLPEEESVASPCGLEVVGTTEGTEGQALSYATRFVLV
jgi:hypothetical protein